MTLAAFAMLVGAPPKWCQNALAVLGLPLRYSAPAARTLGLARLLHSAHEVSLPAAWRLARQALSGSLAASFSAGAPDSVSTLTVDVPRYLSDFTVRRSLARADPPRGRGRPRVPRRTGLREAEVHGLDLSALRAGLAVQPAERLRALDRNQEFVEALRRGRRVP